MKPIIVLMLGVAMGCWATGLLVHHGHDTNIVGIDDAREDFNIDGLFAMISGDPEMEQKGKTE